MDTDQFLKALDLASDVDLSTAGDSLAKFIKILSEKIQEKPTEVNAQINRQVIDALYAGFFNYAKEWSKTEKAKHIIRKDDPNADSLRARGQEVINALEENIVNFTHCYLEIFKVLGQTLIEMERYALPQVGEKINWTTADVDSLHKHYSEKEALLEVIAHMKKAIPILEEAKKHYDAVEKEGRIIFGEEKYDPEIRPVRSSLRKQEFDLAKKKLDKIAAPRKGGFAFGKKQEGNIETFKSHARALIGVLEQNAESLSGQEGRLLLKPDEAHNAIKVAQEAIERKDVYLVKYRIPYIENHVKRIHHLRDKLLVVGTLDSMILIYVRLFRGFAEPLEDVKAVRQYEADVVENIQYMISGQFQEVDNIRERNEDMLKEFSYSLKAFQSVKDRKFNPEEDITEEEKEE